MKLAELLAKIRTMIVEASQPRPPAGYFSHSAIGEYVPPPDSASSLYDQDDASSRRLYAVRDDEG